MERLPILLTLLLVGIVLKLLASWIKDKSFNWSLREPARSVIPEKSYLDLRDTIFRGSRSTFGLPAGESPEKPWAAVMDWGISKGVATVLAVCDGSASIYLGSGGGFVGAGQSHEPIRMAAQNAVALAASHFGQFTRVTKFPLPEKGKVFLYVCADSGVYWAEETQKQMSSFRSSLADLGNAMQSIITEYRNLKSASAVRPQ